jgi:Na+/melibiose symporter-like transporter
MTKQPLRITPQSTLGKWSIGLVIAMPLLFTIGSSFTNSLYRSAPAGDTILEDLILRPLLALTMLAGMAAGVSALVTGLLAIIRQKDHALLVYVSTAIGALLLLFLAGEIVSPH